MRVLVAICLLLTFSVAVLSAPKETPAQKQLINRFAKYVEREGWQVSWIGVQGKSHDVLAFNLPNATVEAVYRFKQCIDRGATREEMKAAGFRSVLIDTGIQSANFPKGKAIFPLD
jgi:hypothetical protein